MAAKARISRARRPRVRLRILDESVVAVGPGKADLLDAIAREGSISGAARSAGMTYRRAWLLVATMNDCFARPLVRTRKGGADGGSAILTPLGRTVLRLYREHAAAARRAFTPLLRLPPAR